MSAACACAGINRVKSTFFGVYIIYVYARVYYTIFVTFLEFNQMYVRVLCTVRATIMRVDICESREADTAIYLYMYIYIISRRTTTARTHYINKYNIHKYMCVCAILFFFFLESDALPKNTFRRYIRNASLANSAVYWFNGLVPHRFGILTLSIHIVNTGYSKGDIRRAYDVHAT